MDVTTLIPARIGRHHDAYQNFLMVRMKRVHYRHRIVDDPVSPRRGARVLTSRRVHRPGTNHRPEPASMGRIRRSTLSHLRKRGILGLRVTDVARSARVSVPLLYKYFNDRDGLIADVLAGVVEDSLSREAALLLASLGINGVGLPVASTGSSRVGRLSPRENRMLRLGAYAAAADNPRLGARLGEVQRRIEQAVADSLRLHYPQAVGAATSPEVAAVLLLAINDVIIDRQLRGDSLSTAQQRRVLQGALHGALHGALDGAVHGAGQGAPRTRPGSRP